jgi:hypothetical protein
VITVLVSHYLIFSMAPRNMRGVYIGLGEDYQPPSVLLSGLKVTTHILRRRGTEQSWGFLGA